MIDYILKTTGVPSLSYIGHSQGTTQIFSALAEDAEWFRERINVFILLAPVARVDRCTASHLRDHAVNQNLIKFMTSLGPEMFPTPSVDGHITSGIFKITGAGSLGMGMLCDDDPKKISQAGMESYMGHFPAGTSYRCLDHYRQLILTDSFKKYDFGLEKNLNTYGCEHPPTTDLSAFSGMPMALFCGRSDKLASPLDYGWLRDILAMNQNCIYFKEYDMGHVAFLMPNEEDRKYFLEMLELCKHFNRLYDHNTPVKGYEEP